LSIAGYGRFNKAPSAVRRRHQGRLIAVPLRFRNHWVWVRRRMCRCFWLQRASLRLHDKLEGYTVEDLHSTRYSTRRTTG
jgi:hypothetical protein